MDSILDHVKKMLGPSPDYDYFDPDVITHINAAFFQLNLLGVGPEMPFAIEDNTAEWSDFMTDGAVELVKNYIPLKVKLMFDPPSNSFLVDNLRKEIDKYEWLLLVDAEKKKLPEADMSGIYIPTE